MTKPPETIWLQHGDPYNPVAENTWCVEPMGVDDCDTEYTRTDTIPTPPRAKPMVWKKTAVLGESRDYADAPLVPLIAYKSEGYTIIRQASRDGSWVLQTTSGENQIATPYLSKAKAAAQADYDHRVLSALDYSIPNHTDKLEAAEEMSKVLEHVSSYFGGYISAKIVEALQKWKEAQ